MPDAMPSAAPVTATQPVWRSTKREDVTRLGAERRSDAHLLGSLAHRVEDRAVEAEEREGERQDSENQVDADDCSRKDERDLEQVVQCHHADATEHDLRVHVGQRDGDGVTSERRGPARAGNHGDVRQVVLGRA